MYSGCMFKPFKMSNYILSTVWNCYSRTKHNNRSTTADAQPNSPLLGQIGFLDNILKRTL